MMFSYWHVSLSISVMLILSQLKAVSKYVSGRVKISETICQQMNSPYQPRPIKVKRIDSSARSNTGKQKPAHMT